MSDQSILNIGTVSHAKPSQRGAERKMDEGSPEPAMKRQGPRRDTPLEWNVSRGSGGVNCSEICQAGEAAGEDHGVL